MKTILIVDDEHDICWAIANIAETGGYSALMAHTGKSALSNMERHDPDLVILDMRLPDMDGMEVLKKMKKINSDVPVIILTGYGDVTSAVNAMKLGAYDYLQKPFDNDEMLMVMNRALEVCNLNYEVEKLRQRLSKKMELGDVVAESAEMKKILEQIKKVAPTDMTVVLQGKSGTGKEIAARLIHSNSLRCDNPFIAIDCGVIPETLIESELFGYEKGAFTGADKRKLGQFELADGGTIFLDEITNLAPSVQAKLLRVIQEREVQHLGGKKSVKIDVRIIVASNILIEDAVKQKMFREDLFHRVNQFAIHLPLLCDKKDDIIPLAQYFLAEANKELHKKVKQFSQDVKDIFCDYSWPGNVRELKNVVTRAALMADETILPEHLPENLRKKTDNKILSGKSIKSAFEKVGASQEKLLINEALKKTSGNKTEAAELLGISRKTLYNKIEELGIK
ncbi:MAG: sigma-54-dependent Fis family transcriptional regulator [Elusimicrobia bacterium]|nr:sigma-54-dependent Fis family transcriptional regulator [Elusimicrobiota bacterium]